MDAAGNAYVVGSTFDPQFPATAGAYQTVYHGPSQVDVSSQPDAFAIKLNPTGTAPVWATYIGGTAQDAASAVTLDASGNVWISGTTASTDFPNAQGWSNGGEFVVELSATGSALPYAGRYPNGTAAGAIAVDAAGLLHIGGSGGILSAIAASPRPVSRALGIANAAWGPVGGRVAAGEVVSLYGPHIGPGTQVYVNDVAAPILYSSDSQINAVTPFGIDGQSTVRVRIGSGPEFIAAVVPSDPQVFQFPGGQAAAINQDGTINGPDNPADRGFDSRHMGYRGRSAVPGSGGRLDSIGGPGFPLLPGVQRLNAAAGGLCGSGSGHHRGRGADQLPAAGGPVHRLHYSSGQEPRLAGGAGFRQAAYAVNA